MSQGTDENFVFANMTPDIINDALKKLKSKNWTRQNFNKFAKVYHTNYHGSYLPFIWVIFQNWGYSFQS